jgi:4-amino-4-deoxy-L-arabinose transferase-like glycosyltransferase
VKNLVVLLVAGLLVLTINAGKLSLLSLDDCFYARKGIEMARSGRFFTVTWNYKATFQNPPLHFWILGKSFQIFGENDFAARLPSILMALGLLFFTYQIASQIGSSNAALTAVALLLITPHFLSNGRRCMLEIPLAFWISAAFFVFIKALHRPKFHILLALPLGAALLTKSLLGLMPIAVFLVTAIFSSEIRKTFTQIWFWIGIAGGIIIGVTWPIHEFSRFGVEALREHYVGEIFSRSVRDIAFYKLILGYPLILFSVFLPVALLAIPGVTKIFREKRQSGTPVLLLVWILLPLIGYSFSTARSSRYIFPIFPALAIAGGYWLESKFPRLSSVLYRIAVPILLIALTALFWISPEMILKDENKLLKANHQVVRKAIPELEPAPYIGTRYWSIANPLLYYAERQLAVPSESDNAISQARKGSGNVVFDSQRVKEIQRSPGGKIIFTAETWSLLTVE